MIQSKLPVDRLPLCFYLNTALPSRGNSQELHPKNSQSLLRLPPPSAPPLLLNVTVIYISTIELQKWPKVTDLQDTQDCVCTTGFQRQGRKQSARVNSYHNICPIFLFTAQEQQDNITKDALSSPIKVTF